MVLDQGIVAADETLQQPEGIGIGEELFITGLFTGHTGKQRNLPIIRSGIIAAMPGEPLRDDSGDEYMAYLAEVRSLGGLSGSPVFAIVTRARHRQIGDRVGLLHRRSYLSNTESSESFGEMVDFTSKVFLLGLVRGHWEFGQTGPIQFGVDVREKINAGIAIVTPIQEVMKLLDREDLVKERRQLDKKLADEQKKNNRQVNDSAFGGERPLTDTEFTDALRKVSKRVPPRGQTEKGT
jgi:hypothetical protein